MKNEKSDPPLKEAGKKTYHPPAFRFERVFEVSSLSCGKVSTMQASCHLNTKAS